MVKSIKAILKVAIVASLIAFASTLAIAQVTTEQTARIKAHNDSLEVRLPRFVVVDDYVREILRRDWDAHVHDAVKLERAYCLGWQYDIWAHEKAYRVTQIMPADSADATPSSISFVCPPNWVMLRSEVHIHPAQTCINGECWDGGPYAWQCLPSDADRAWLNRLSEPFGIVQCDRNALVFYFPLGDPRAK